MLRKNFQKLEASIALAAAVVVVGASLLIGAVVVSAGDEKEARQAGRQLICEEVNGLKNIHRGELGRKIARTERILKEQPGPRVEGIRRELIEEGLADDKTTVKELKPLDCKAFARLELTNVQKR